MKTMRAAILNIGTELLVGHVLNTHAQYLTKWLNHLGYSVYYHMSCGDNPTRIKEALDFLSNHATLILVTGGLGPTQDDITRQVVADFLQVPLERRQDIVDRIDNYFVKFNRVATRNNYLQADFPQGAVVLDNPMGTAPGFAICSNELTIACLPGPPGEVRAVTEEALASFLVGEGNSLYNRFITLYGIGESAVDEKISDIFEGQVDPTLGIYAADGTLSLRLSTIASSYESAQGRLEPMADQLIERLGDYVVSKEGLSVPATLLKVLKEKNLTISFAESCTGGLLSKFVTDYPGSSDAFELGLVVYSNREKRELLDVPAITLADYGAVSENVALAMLNGLKKRSKAEICMAITGIAGPDGGSLEKPVGTVCIAYGILDEIFVKTYRFPGNRERVRIHTALTAFKTVIDHIKD